MSLKHRLLNLLRRDQLDVEIDAELQSHLDLRIDDNIARGMSPAEARRDALLRLGNPTVLKERTHQSDAALTLDSLYADLRYALRQLKNSPAFALTAILTIALAIAANTAVFTLVHAILLRQLPFAQPDRVFHVDNIANIELGYDMKSNNYQASFNQKAASFKTIDAASMYSSGGVNLSANSSASQRIQASETSARFFEVLGVQPQLGRAFLKSEDIPGSDHVALISDRLWRTQFNADPSVLNRTITANGQLFSIIGVLPQNMDFPANTDLWTPTIFDTKTFLREGGAFFSWVIVRASPNTTPAQLRAEFQTRAQNRNPKQPLTEDNSARLTPISGELTKSIRSSLLILTAAVSFVLLIACANIAGLTLVRTARRRSEFAIRAALGAARGRLLRQQLVESLTISLSGAALGILFAQLALELLYIFKPAALDNFPRPTIDLAVLSFTALIATFTGLAFGIVPAWQASREDPATALKTGLWRISISSSRLRKALVTSEIALAFVLLIAAGLLLRTIVNLNKVPLGYSTTNILSFSVSLHGPRYELPEKSTPAVANFYSTALTRLANRHGVISAAIISTPPLDTRADMLLPITTVNNKTTNVFAAPRVTSPNYFATLGIPILNGRDFSAVDTSTSPHVSIITSDLAAQLWPDQNPLGRQLHCAFFCDKPTTVIGVVAPNHRFGPRSESMPQYYLPYTQQDWTYMTFLLSTQSNPSQLAQSTRSIMADIDPTQPLYDMKSMQERLNDNQSLIRFELFTLTTFAILSATLAFLGLYGVIAYTVTQRTSEIGLRIALGAHRATILAAILKDSAQLALAGAALGILAALALTRYLASTLFGVTPHDPITLASVAILFLAVSLLATLIPAQRAASINPTEALRSE